MPDRMPERMSEYMPERMTSRWYVRNYVRIMDQGGDHSKKVISWKCFDRKWTGHPKFDVERPCYHHRFSLSLGFVKKILGESEKICKNMS